MTDLLLVMKTRENRLYEGRWPFADRRAILSGAFVKIFHKTQQETTIIGIVIFSFGYCKKREKQGRLFAEFIFLLYFCANIEPWE